LFGNLPSASQQNVVSVQIIFGLPNPLSLNPTKNSLQVQAGNMCAVILMVITYSPLPKAQKPIYTDKSTLSAKFKRRVAGNLFCFVAFAIAYTGSQVLFLGYPLTELLTSWVFWLFFLLLGVPPYLWSVRSNIIMIRRLKEADLHTTKRKETNHEVSD